MLTLCLNHAIDSAGLTLCWKPILDLHLRRRATLYPGRPITTKKSIPKIPIPGSYCMREDRFDLALGKLRLLILKATTHLDTQVNVLGDTESEVSGFRKVTLA